MASYNSWGLHRSVKKQSVSNRVNSATSGDMKTTEGKTSEIQKNSVKRVVSPALEGGIKRNSPEEMSETQKVAVNKYNEIKGSIASAPPGMRQALADEIRALALNLPEGYKEAAAAFAEAIVRSGTATEIPAELTDADLRYDPRYKELVEYFDKSAELDKRYEEFNSLEFQNRWEEMVQQDRDREVRRRELLNREGPLTSEELAELRNPFTDEEMEKRRELWRKIYELRDDTEETMDHFKQFLKKEKNNAEEAKLKKKSNRTQDEHLLLKAYEKAESELEKHKENLEKLKKKIDHRNKALDELHKDVMEHPEKSHLTREEIEGHFRDHGTEYAKEFNKIIGGKENLQRKSKIIEVLVSAGMDYELQTFQNALNEDISGHISEAQTKLAARSEKAKPDTVKTLDSKETKTLLPKVNPSTFGAKSEENKIYPPSTPSKKRIDGMFKSKLENRR